MKALIEQLDTMARDYLPILQQHSDDAEVIAWSELHGWDPSDVETHLLLARQALLNAVIRQTFPDLSFYETPIDFVSAPSMLVSKIYEMAQRAQSFNFWGELYSALIPQPHRRRVGQFWTDECIAEWMVAWLLKFRIHNLADIGCGAGNFLLKAAQFLRGGHHAARLYGFDVSPLLLNVTQAAFSTYHLPLPELAVKNYLESSLPTDADAIICNPPYTRHHHIAPDVKDRLQGFFKSMFNVVISRKATMAFHFLMKLVAEMPEGAHAAIIVPMEVLDARYGSAAKRVLCRQTVLSAIIHFSQEMNAFHKVDVGASILLFRKGHEKDNIVRHVTLKNVPTTEELLSCLDSPESRELPYGSLVIQSQSELLEIPKWSGIATFTPETKRWEQTGLVVPLKALAKVMRGIATGANEFFALSTQEVRRRSLEPYVVRTIQRNREIQDIVLDEAAWQVLSNQGKRVWLLYLNGEAMNRHPEISSYLSEGEAKGYHRRGLVQTRKQWYFMEQRDIPPIFFTILTRGNPRFILNQAGVRPLNMFSLIYPNSYVVKADCIEHLWALLNSTFSLSRLHSVSRTYGGNTLKVEPRELDNLPVINPLALPVEYRQSIKGTIDDFYRHRDATVLVREIDALIDTLLSSETVTQYRSSLPMQLQLLESRKKYGQMIDEK
ncbi:MAG: SAM-dependent DNA methyltransferase [Chloroflexi bacterium]|nr:SAM-dependent DNA methyltransferase [Chloroflexota bacterium]